ncbi:3'-5' exonuclease [Bradyrhizobium canariense]|uniref:3'-5' exonuclease n=1 Tax=Bradyrhizobium canariense TaxID=255045 RepID=UPI000A19474A|nr:3'-5' exonuclease [Bradyrhizobium canariense]OSI32785.1 DNA polymerase III subunit epsilon [Bradyrhizobium canariense]OSI36865.1 DNA polymerase III subunit epsilon [Bradyrhizobium canariense]OSI49982.1 DNA polymerase III subunit epsilon [Bradyrhizobium canariense]OSI55586.1 DNA polymerase III subunit epsilon [Bradyrhizobium canariense]OSI58971.1 DNA polymerase III subunit epsilon [Bradyrhizobium canariense]
MGVDTDQFWVVDVEGSGGSPPEIVELAMLEVKDLALTDNKRHWFIRPDRGIQPSATRIHGLTDDDVADAPSIEDIADDVLMWIGEPPIVGHNVKIEVEILKRSMPDWTPRAAFDTLTLAKALKPGLPSYGLANLGAEFGLADKAAQLTGQRHHSALYDATLTALILIHLLTPLPSSERDRALRDANILDPRQGSLL